MPQIAGLRGVLYDPARVELGRVISSDDPHAVQRLTAGEGGATVGAWLDDGVLKRDPARAIYRYHQVFRHADLGDRNVVRKALLAAVKLEPWTDGTIRQHEVADPAARDASLRAITANRAQIEPVLAGYHDAAGEIERLMRRVDGERTTLEVTTPDGTLHQLWRVRDAELIGSLRRMFAPKKLHILDGTAHYEAMLAYRNQLEAARPLATYSSANYGLAAMVRLDDPTLRPTGRHRVIRGPFERAAVLAVAATWFIVEKLPGAARDLARQHTALADSVAHQPAFIAAFAGDPDAWKLTLKPDVSPAAEGVHLHRALAKLDPAIVDALFVGRALGAAAQVTTTIDHAAALASLDQGASVAVITRPLAVEQIVQLGEVGQQLPAGSSAFVPPLALGLVIHAIDPDEDLV